MDLTGIAGRALLQRLSVGRRKESDRAASNDNEASPVEVGAGRRGAGGKEEGEGHRASPATTERTSPAEHRQAMSADVRGQ
jgi:hypothetical protein